MSRHVVYSYRNGADLGSKFHANFCVYLFVHLFFFIYSFKLFYKNLPFITSLFQYFIILLLYWLLHNFVILLFYQFIISKTGRGQCGSSLYPDIFSFCQSFFHSNLRRGRNVHTYSTTVRTIHFMLN